jgi:hypothetical protein
MSHAPTQAEDAGVGVPATGWFTWEAGFFTALFRLRFGGEWQLHSHKFLIRTPSILSNEDRLKIVGDFLGR